MVTSCVRTRNRRSVPVGQSHDRPRVFHCYQPCGDHRFGLSVPQVVVMQQFLIGLAIGIGVANLALFLWLMYVRPWL